MISRIGGRSTRFVHMELAEIHKHGLRISYWTLREERELTDLYLAVTCVVHKWALIMHNLYE